MIWSPAPTEITQVNAGKPDANQNVPLTVMGGGFVANVSIFLALSSTTAEQLVAAIKGKHDQAGVVVATNVALGGGGSLTCTAAMKGKKHGSYDVIAAQVDGEELQVAMKTAAFNWK
jgi:hypothetical protein